ALRSSASSTSRSAVSTREVPAGPAAGRHVIRLPGDPASATIAAPMLTLGRVVLLLLVTASLVAAGVPPALDEDRSGPGFCSPDCPLQQDATHSGAGAPPAPRYNRTAEATRERPAVPSAPAELTAAAALDAPRA